AGDIHNQVRGFYPLCYSQWRGQTLKIMETVPLGEAYWQQLPTPYHSLIKAYQTGQPPEGKPGEIVALIKQWGPVINTGDGHLLLHTVQPPGKRPQSGWDFVNGNRLNVGEMLGD
ncbi:MAG: methionyl-tRNA formyltransferase, partial [Prochlorothrix sp.]